MNTNFKKLEFREMLCPPCPFFPKRLCLEIVKDVESQLVFNASKLVEDPSCFLPPSIINLNFEKSRASASVL
jgi:hypothetical protein